MSITNPVIAPSVIISPHPRAFHDVEGLVSLEDWKNARTPFTRQPNTFRYPFYFVPRPSSELQTVYGFAPYCICNFHATGPRFFQTTAYYEIFDDTKVEPITKIYKYTPFDSGTQLGPLQVLDFKALTTDYASTFNIDTNSYGGVWYVTVTKHLPDFDANLPKESSLTRTALFEIRAASYITEAGATSVYGSIKTFNLDTFEKDFPQITFEILPIDQNASPGVIRVIPKLVSRTPTADTYNVVINSFKVPETLSISGENTYFYKNISTSTSAFVIPASSLPGGKIISYVHTENYIKTALIETTYVKSGDTIIFDNEITKREDVEFSLPLILITETGAVSCVPPSGSEQWHISSLLLPFDREQSFTNREPIYYQLQNNVTLLQTLSTFSKISVSEQDTAVSPFSDGSVSLRYDYVLNQQDNFSDFRTAHFSWHDDDPTGIELIEKTTTNNIVSSEFVVLSASFIDTGIVGVSAINKAPSLTWEISGISTNITYRALNPVILKLNDFNLWTEGEQFNTTWTGDISYFSLQGIPNRYPICDEGVHYLDRTFIGSNNKNYAGVWDVVLSKQDNTLIVFKTLYTIWDKDTLIVKQVDNNIIDVNNVYSTLSAFYEIFVEYDRSAPGQPFYVYSKGGAVLDTVTPFPPILCNRFYSSISIHERNATQIDTFSMYLTAGRNLVDSYVAKTTLNQGDLEFVGANYDCLIYDESRGTSRTALARHRQLTNLNDDRTIANIVAFNDTPITSSTTPSVTNLYVLSSFYDSTNSTVNFEISCAQNFYLAGYKNYNAPSPVTFFRNLAFNTKINISAADVFDAASVAPGQDNVAVWHLVISTQDFQAVKAIDLEVVYTILTEQNPDETITFLPTFEYSVREYTDQSINSALLSSVEIFPAFRESGTGQGNFETLFFKITCDQALLDEEALRLDSQGAINVIGYRTGIVSPTPDRESSNAIYGCLHRNCKQATLICPQPDLRGIIESLVVKAFEATIFWTPVPNQLRDSVNIIAFISDDESLLPTPALRQRFTNEGSVYKGSGLQCVYIGSDLPGITVTNLTNDTKYFVRIFTFCLPGRNYNINNLSNSADFTTLICDEPVSFASNAAATQVRTRSARLSWNNSLDVTRRVVILEPDNGTLLEIPANISSDSFVNSTYFGGTQIIYDTLNDQTTPTSLLSAVSSVQVTGLTANTVYRFGVFEYCGNYTFSRNKPSDDSNQNTFATLICNRPDFQAKNILINPTTTTAEITWESENPDPRPENLTKNTDSVVIIKQGSDANNTINALIADGRPFSNISTEFISPTSCVFDGNDTSVIVTNLQPDTEYTVFVADHCNYQYVTRNASGNPKTFKTQKCTNPTVQTTDLSATNISSISATISWQSGNGDKRAVVIKNDSDFLSNALFTTLNTPGLTSNNTYTQYNDFQVLYIGPNSAIDIFGLNAGTTYYVRSFEICDNDGQLLFNQNTENNLVTFKSNDPVTRQIIQSYSLSATNISSVSSTINWQNGTGEKRILVINKQTDFKDTQALNDILDSINITANPAYANNGPQCVFDSVNGPTNIINLQNNTLYTGRVFDYITINNQRIYNRSATTENYIEFITSDLASNVPVQSFNLSTTNINQTSATLIWQNGSGDKRIIVMTSGSDDFANTADLFNLFNLGSALPVTTPYVSGVQCVFDGVGTMSLDLLELTPSTTYLARVFDYNDRNNIRLYNTQANQSNKTLFVTHDAYIDGECIPTGNNVSNISIKQSSIGLTTAGTLSCTITWTNGESNARVIILNNTPLFNLPTKEPGTNNLPVTQVNTTHQGEEQYIALSLTPQATSVNVFNLSADIPYYVRGHELCVDSDSLNYNYVNFGYLEFTLRTFTGCVPPSNPSDINISPTQTTADISWSTNTVAGGTLMYLTSSITVLQSLTSPPNGTSDFTPSLNYTQDPQVIVFDTKSNISISGLQPNTTYFTAAFAFCTGDHNFNNNKVTNTFTTICDPGLDQLEFIGFQKGEILNTGNLYWKNGSGGGRVILVSTSLAALTGVVDGESFIANNDLQELSFDSYQCVLNSTTNTVTSVEMINLQPEQVYYARGFEYCIPHFIYNKINNVKPFAFSYDINQLCSPAGTPSDIQVVPYQTQAFIQWTPALTNNLTLAFLSSSIAAIPTNFFQDQFGPISVDPVIANESQVISYGADTDVLVTNLTPGTRYYLTLYTYCTAGDEPEIFPFFNYLTPATYVFDTVCSPEDTNTKNFSITNTSSTSGVLRWDNGVGDGRALFISTLTTKLTGVSNNIVPTLVASTHTGNDQQCILFTTNSSVTSLALTGLLPNVSYYVRGYEFCTPELIYNDQFSTPPFHFILRDSSIGCTRPIQQSKIQSNPIGRGFATLNLEPGSGAGRSVIVTLAQNQNIIDIPPDQISPPSPSTFFNPDNAPQYVYDARTALSTSFEITGLASKTTYLGAVFEYCITDNNPAQRNYTLDTTDNYVYFTTHGCYPTSNVSIISASVITSTSAVLHWNRGNGDGRVLYINTVNNFPTPPAPNLPTETTNTYTAGVCCIFIEQGNDAGTVTVSGLSANQGYWIRAFEFCDDNPGITYNTTQGGLGSINPYYFQARDASPGCDMPTKQLTFLTPIVIEDLPGSVLIRWIAGTGNGRVIYVNTENNFIPPDNDTSPEVVQDRIYTGSGQQCVYNGSEDCEVADDITICSTIVSGLSGNQQYFIIGFEYNDCPDVGTDVRSYRVDYDELSLTSFTTQVCKPPPQINFIRVCEIQQTTNGSVSASIQLDPDTLELGNKGFAVFLNTQNQFDLPIDGIVPVIGSTTVSGATAISVGSTNSFTINNLQLNTTYFIRAYAYCLPDISYSSVSTINNPASFVTRSNLDCGIPCIQTRLNQPTSVTTSVNITWTAGDGDGRAVFLRKRAPSQSLSPLPPPDNNVIYPVNTQFTGTLEPQCIAYVTDPNITSVSCTNLEVGNVIYDVQSFEFNSCDPYINYNISRGPNSLISFNGGPCLAPTIQTSGLFITNVQDTQTTIRWTRGNGSNRVVFINTQNSFNVSFGQFYTPDIVFKNSGQQCIFNGSGDAVTVIGLTPNQRYWIRAYEYCLPNRTYNILTAPGNPIEFTPRSTIGCIPPVTTVSNIQATINLINVTIESVSWTPGNGSGRVVYISDSPNFIPPPNGPTVQVNTEYLGAGQQAIYFGTGDRSTSIVTGLDPGIYYIRAYEFCVVDGYYNYNTASGPGNPIQVSFEEVDENPPPEININDISHIFTYPGTYTVRVSSLTGDFNSPTVVDTLARPNYFKIFDIPPVSRFSISNNLPVLADYRPVLRIFSQTPTASSLMYYNKRDAQDTISISKYTVNLNTWETAPGSFPIEQINVDFGDNTPIIYITRDRDVTLDAGDIAFPFNVTDPRNKVLTHTYEISATQSFTITITAFSKNTNSYTIGSKTLQNVTPSRPSKKFLLNSVLTRSDDVIYNIQTNNVLNTILNVNATVSEISYVLDERYKYSQILV